ncbi:MAG: L,D-transpeptidase [Microgenomates group bacterium]
MAEENNIKNFVFLSILSIFLLPFLFLDQFRPDSIPNPTPPQVLGNSIILPSSNSKRIEVDLTTQRLYAYQDNQKIFDYSISSGTWNRTPNGTFTIWTKIRSQKMSGGSKELGNYYYLPNVPYIMFFYNDKTAKKIGYSIHGAYWHNNFGVPMSHGCINMRPDESALIYNWAEVGTPITISGKYSPSLSQK